MTTVFVTKYALTKGLMECELIEADVKTGYAWVKWEGGCNGRNMFTRNEWHFSEAGALAEAEGMRVARIKSLQKQIAKLKGLEF